MAQRCQELVSLLGKDGFAISRLTTDGTTILFTIIELFGNEGELVLLDQRHLHFHVLLVGMVEICKLQSDLICVVVCWVLVVVLVAELLDPFGDLEFSLASLGLHIIVLLHVHFTIDEGYLRLFFALF